MSDTNSETGSYDFFIPTHDVSPWQVATGGTVITFRIGYDDRVEARNSMLRGTTPDGYESVIDVDPKDDAGVATDAELSTAALYVIAALVECSDDVELWEESIVYYEGDDEDESEGAAA